MTLIQRGRESYRRAAERYPRFGALRANRLVFDNGRPLRTNLAFLRHWRRCRRMYVGATPAGGPFSIGQAARELKQTGFTIVRPPDDTTVVRSLTAQVQTLVDEGKVTVTPGIEEWMVQVSYAFERVSGLARLVTPDVVATLEATYGCHFKIYSAEAYRLVPSDSPPDVSSLWHTDNYPPGLLKAMVYLTDCDRDSGALRVHPLPTTRRLLRRGFMNRYDAERYSSILERNWTALEGSAGTVVLWNSNIVHKATSPAAGIRDAVAMKFLPSTEPWSVHLARAGSLVCYERRTQIPDDPGAD